MKPAAVEAALQRLLKDREIVQTIESLRRAGAKRGIPFAGCAPTKMLSAS